MGNTYSPSEGMAAVSPDGQILAINRAGLIFGNSQESKRFGAIFHGLRNQSLRLDRSLQARFQALSEISRNGGRFQVQLRGQIPASTFSGRIFDDTSIAARPPRRQEGAPNSLLTLDTLNAGDPNFSLPSHGQGAFSGHFPSSSRASRRRQEMFAKAFTTRDSRRSGPFIALNCAAIPETLIESELFGYQGGAFTGARKEGAPGRFSRPMAEPCSSTRSGTCPQSPGPPVTGLAGTQHHSARELPCRRGHILVCNPSSLAREVARGQFPRRSYYRLNGLCVTLPALRERNDLRILAKRSLRGEVGANSAVRFRKQPWAMERYPWPGNIRQLSNVIQSPFALLDEHETVITETTLPGRAL